MGLTRAEQETVIRWDEETGEVHIWTASPKTMRKMARLGIVPTGEAFIVGKSSSRGYRVGVEQFRWGLKRKGVRPATGFRARPSGPASPSTT